MYICWWQFMHCDFDRQVSIANFLVQEEYYDIVAVLLVALEDYCGFYCIIIICCYCVKLLFRLRLPYPRLTWPAQCTLNGFADAESRIEIFAHLQTRNCVLHYRLTVKVSIRLSDAKVATFMFEIFPSIRATLKFTVNVLWASLNLMPLTDVHWNIGGKEWGQKIIHNPP